MKIIYFWQIFTSIFVFSSVPQTELKLLYLFRITRSYHYPYWVPIEYILTFEVFQVKEAEESLDIHNLPGNPLYWYQSAVIRCSLHEDTYGNFIVPPLHMLPHADNLINLDPLAAVALCLGWLVDAELHTRGPIICVPKTINLSHWDHQPSQ